MAITTEIGSFTVQATTGVQTIPLTNASLTPVAFVFWGERATGLFAAGAFALGFDDGTNHVGTALAAGDFGRAFDDPQAVWSDSASILRCRTTFSFEIRLVGFVQSIGTGTFDVNWTVNNVTACTVNYMAIGGAGLQVAIGRKDYSATGSVALPFRPVAGIVQHNGVGSGTQTGGGATSSYGFFAQCNSDAQVSLVNRMDGVSNPSNTFGAQTVSSTMIASSTAITGKLTIATASGGFNYTWTGASLGYFTYFAIGGAIAANVGTFTQGASSITISASSPKAVLFGSNCRIHSTVGSVDSYAVFGAANSLTQRCVWFADPDNIAPPSWANSQLDTTHAILIRTPTGDQISTLSARATVTALNAASIALTWDTDDSVARELFYLVFADDVGTGPCGTTSSGGIVVTKHTSVGSSQSFDFTTTGGLSPSTFSLTDGGSQSFSSLGAATYGVSEVPAAGWTTSYSVSSGEPHTAIAISGNVVTVEVTNSYQTTTSQLRRYRRFAMPYGENLWMFIKRLEIIAQMGVGTSILNPTITLRLSKDGGQTYSITRTMTLGLDTDYTKRAFTLALGQARNPIVEVYIDDPVFCALVACSVDVEKGIS